VLRVRLNELEQEVKSKSTRLDELEKERTRILQDHNDSSGLQSHALDGLKVDGLCSVLLLLLSLLLANCKYPALLPP